MSESGKFKSMKTNSQQDCQLMLAILISASWIVVSFCGCSTLASLGFPFASSNNEILKPAKEFSEAPGQSILTAKELAKRPMELYIVEIGDTILIESVNFDATIRLPGDQVVKPDGHISLGEFGRYMAEGKTLEQIEIEVQSIIDTHLKQNLEMEFAKEQMQLENNGEAFLNSGTGNESEGDIIDESELEVDELVDPLDSDQQRQELLERRIAQAIAQNQVSVRLVNWDSKKIYVLGEVNSPGSFVYIGNETVLDAIIEAGGLTTRANRHQIIVSRPTPCSSCREVMKFCYDYVVQLGDASTNYQLRPGDRVFVPSLTFCEDLKRTLLLQKGDHCPRCADCPRPCDLPIGCD